MEVSLLASIATNICSVFEFSREALHTQYTQVWMPQATNEQTKTQPKSFEAMFD